MALRLHWRLAGIAVLATGLAVAGASAGWLGPAGRWLAPWQRAWTPAADAFPERVRQLEEQVARLNAENAVLAGRLDQYRQVAGEGSPFAAPLALIRARPVARTRRAARRYLELDAGAEDGVQRGMAACAGWTLAGLVVGVQESRCLVQEVGDAESRIAATVLAGGQPQCEGALIGTGRADWCLLNFIEDREGLRLEPGMAVVTAGNDGRLPPGLRLGTVARASRGQGAEHWEIAVRPAAETTAQESYLIVRFAPPRAAPPPPPPANEGDEAK